MSHIYRLLKIKSFLSLLFYIFLFLSFSYLFTLPSPPSPPSLPLSPSTLQSVSSHLSFLTRCLVLYLHSSPCTVLPFLCHTAPVALSSEFSGRLFSHNRWMCFSERAGMAVTSAGTAQKQTKPPAPLRKLVQAPPITHKHNRVRSTNSLKKKKAKDGLSCRKPGRTGPLMLTEEDKAKRCRGNDTLGSDWGPVCCWVSRRWATEKSYRSNVPSRTASCTVVEVLYVVPTPSVDAGVFRPQWAMVCCVHM